MSQWIDSTREKPELGRKVMIASIGMGPIKVGMINPDSGVWVLLDGEEAGEVDFWMIPPAPDPIHPVIPEPETPDPADEEGRL